MYRIIKEGFPPLLHVIFSGFMTPEEADCYASARCKAVSSAGWSNGQYSMIIDISDFRIQAQSVIDRLAQLALAEETKPRRIAFVTGDTASRMQVKRVFKDAPHIRITATVDEARAFLDESTD